MFSLQLPKTSLRFQLADLPTWAPVDDREETITDTHAALSKLLADCKKYVGAVVASCVMVGWASMAQETPQKNNIPVGTVATQPVGKEIPGAVVEISFRVPEGRDVSQKDATSSSPSATLQATNGYWQTVEFNWEKISVAEVQAKIGAMSPEEQKKAINSMSEATGDIYEAYMDSIKQADIASKEEKMKIQEMVITNNEEKLKIQERAIAENQIKLQKNQKAMEKWNTEIIKLLTKIEHNKSLLGDNEIMILLQTAYDNRDFWEKYPSVISKIEKYIREAPQFGG